MKEAEARAAALAQFHSQNHGAGKWEDVNEEGAQASSSGAGSAATAAGTEFERKQQKEMKAYWLPSKTPEAKKSLDKPDTATKCPCVRFPPLPLPRSPATLLLPSHQVAAGAAHLLYRPCGPDALLACGRCEGAEQAGGLEQTGKNLRMKELISIKWTPAPKDAGGDAASMCPLCKKCFGASSQIKILKVRGAALLLDAVAAAFCPHRVAAMRARCSSLHRVHSP